MPAGIYKLKSTYNNTLKQCSGKAEVEITILKAPHEIIGPKKVCADEEFNFQTLDPDPNTVWTLSNEFNEIVDTATGDEYFHKISEPGIYIISATSADRCDGAGFIFTVYELPARPQGDFLLPEKVCPNLPYNIIFLNTDTTIDLSEYDLKWDIQNGEILEVNNTQLEVIFNENPAGDYRVSLNYKQKQKPYCTSEQLLSEIILPVTVETDIEPYNPVNNNIIATNLYCTSTETSFRVDELSGDEYNWSIVPDNFGNIVQGQDSPEITVLWNEISGVTTGYVQLEIRKCAERFVIDEFEVELIEAPSLNWNPPNQVCAGEPFNITFSGTPSLDSYDSVSLELGNGQVYSNPITISPSVYEFNNISYDNVQSPSVNYTMQLVISGPNGCFHPAIATTDVTVLPAPIATISPNNFTNTFCDLLDLSNSNVILTATEQGGIVQANSYQWYLNNLNNPIQGATGPTHQVMQFGSYIVEITGTNGCTGIAQSYQIKNMNCNGGGNDPGQGSDCLETASVDTVIWKTCNTIEASLTVSTTPDDITWSAHPSDGINLTSTSNLDAVYEVTKPGSYLIMAEVFWEDCGGEKVQESVIIDYQPLLHYEVNCNLQNNDYEVILYNNSPFISGQPPQQTIFYVNNTPYSYPGNEDKHHITLPSGSHTFSLEISSPGMPVCSTDPITIDLSLPDASFSLPAQTCEGDVVVLEPDNPNPNNHYEWVFNETSNLNTIVEATLLEENNKKVTLHVTDRYGCTVSHTEFIDVNKADHSDYAIKSLPETACIGETITLSYTNAQGQAFTGTYQWYFNEAVITGANSSTYTTSVSGQYGLEVTSVEGCVTRIDPTPVLFQPLPEVTIDGPLQAICAGTEFNLEGSSDDETLSRRWLREGVQIHPLSPSTPWILEDIVESTPGSYTYILEVGDPALQECTNTESFTVEVLPTPTENDIQLSFQVTCNPFEVIATVTNPDPNGQYNWSNGTSGTQISVNHSGVLGLRYTNASGCSIWKSIDIPRHPEELIWVFPTGCIENCEDPSLNYNYVIGPLPSMDNYAWLLDDSGNMQGGFVSPYNINYPGNLQLYLGENILGTYCEVYSEPLQLTINQKGCNPCAEELLRIEIEDIRIGTSYPFLYYELSVQISNALGDPLTLELYSPDGVYIPGSITIGAGQTIVVSIDFIPDTGFMGGNSDLVIRMMQNGNLLCFYEQTIDFPVSFAPSMDSTAELSVVPNPAIENTEVRYKFETTDKVVVRLYSLTGIILIEKELPYSTGSVQLDLNILSSGTYIIVVEDDSGQRLQQHIIKK